MQDIFDSDFSDNDKEIDTKPLSDIIVKKEVESIDLSDVSDDDDYILLTEEETVNITTEKIVFISTNKNTVIRLPYLKNNKYTKKKKGKLYRTKKITIKALREQYTHTVFPAKNNTINGNGGVYMLRPGIAVTFYSLGRSWHADK